MRTTRQVTIALGQFAPAQGDTAANLAKMDELIGRAAEAGADLVVFPELAHTGYALEAEEFLRLAEPQDGPFARHLCAQAREKGVHLIAGYAEAGAHAEAPFNSCLFIDDTGSILENMRKVYLWKKEKVKFRAGGRFPVVKTKLGSIGLLICYDMEYPEPARIEALKGAEIIVNCAAWSIPAAHRWQVDMAANALFNLLFMVGANPSDARCCGASMIVGPDGRIRAAAPEAGEALLVHTIDLQEISVIRSKIPYFNDFKEETFAADAVKRF